MNSGVATDLWGHVFSCLQPSIWYLVDDAEEEFHPTLCRSISLSASLYQILLVDSVVMYRYGSNLRFSLRLDDLKIHLQENLGIRYTRNFCKQEEKQFFSLCVCPKIL
jgi:hypothetical protein